MVRLFCSRSSPFLFKRLLFTGVVAAVGVGSSTPASAATTQNELDPFSALPPPPLPPTTTSENNTSVNSNSSSVGAAAPAERSLFSTAAVTPASGFASPTMRRQKVFAVGVYTSESSNKLLFQRGFFFPSPSRNSSSWPFGSQYSGWNSAVCGPFLPAVFHSPRGFSGVTATAVRSAALTSSNVGFGSRSFAAACCCKYDQKERFWKRNKLTFFFFFFARKAWRRRRLGRLSRFPPFRQRKTFRRHRAPNSSYGAHLAHRSSSTHQQL